MFLCAKLLHIASLSSRDMFVITARTCVYVMTQQYIAFLGAQRHGVAVVTCIVAC